MTKWERRERKWRKARYGMRVKNRSILLLAALAIQPKKKRRKSK